MGLFPDGWEETMEAGKERRLQIRRKNDHKTPQEMPLQIVQHRCNAMCPIRGCFGGDLFKRGWMEKMPEIKVKTLITTPTTTTNATPKSNPNP